MEASERQLNINESSVRVLEDRLVIEALEVVDERAARIVRERIAAEEQPAETVTKAIEIGARVLDREGTAAEVDFVRVEFERMQAEARERIAEHDRNVADWMQSELKNVPQSVKDQVGKMLEETRQTQIADVLKQLGERTDRTMREARESDAREQAKMREQIASLTEALARAAEREDADQRVAEAEEAGTRKGISFEGRVHDAIERIAATRGDSATHTGGEQAEGGGKKGDTLVELGAADGAATGRVLFEAKDRKLSKNDAWRELNEGMAKRAATFGVLVVAGEERMPSGRQPLTEYQGNKLIVAVDRDEPDGIALEVAYRLAVARVLIEREGDLEVDAAAVKAAVEEIGSILKNAQAIRSVLTGIQTQSDKAKDGVNEMVAAVTAKLEQIEALVDAPTETN